MIIEMTSSEILFMSFFVDEHWSLDFLQRNVLTDSYCGWVCLKFWFNITILHTAFKTAWQKLLTILSWINVWHSNGVPWDRSFSFQIVIFMYIESLLHFYFYVCIKNHDRTHNNEIFFLIFLRSVVPLHYHCSTIM